MAHGEHNGFVSWVLKHFDVETVAIYTNQMTPALLLHSTIYSSILLKNFLGTHWQR